MSRKSALIWAASICFSTATAAKPTGLRNKRRCISCTDTFIDIVLLQPIAGAWLCTVVMVMFCRRCWLTARGRRHQVPAELGRYTLVTNSTRSILSNSTKSTECRKDVRHSSSFFQSVLRWSVAVFTICRHSSRVVAFLQAVARPKFRGPRSASIARSRVWLGLPAGRFRSGLKNHSLSTMSTKLNMFNLATMSIAISCWIRLCRQFARMADNVKTTS